MGTIYKYISSLSLYYFSSSVPRDRNGYRRRTWWGSGIQYITWAIPCPWQEKCGTPASAQRQVKSKLDSIFLVKQWTPKVSYIICTRNLSEPISKFLIVVYCIYYIYIYIYKNRHVRQEFYFEFWMLTQLMKRSWICKWIFIQFTNFGMEIVHKYALVYVEMLCLL
jgi:hypothetical protein